MVQVSDQFGIHSGFVEVSLASLWLDFDAYLGLTLAWLEGRFGATKASIWRHLRFTLDHFANRIVIDTL